MTYKNYHIRWIASIWCRKTIQNNAKLQKWSNYDELHAIWHQNERKCRVRSQTIQNNAKVQKWSKYNDLHRYDVKSDHNYDEFGSIWRTKTIKNIELRRKPFKTTLNYKSDQNTMTFTDLMSNTSKQHKTTIWCQIKIIKLHELHRFDVKTIKTTQNYRSDQIGRQNEQKCWVTSKTFKTTLNYKSDQNTMTCIDLMSKRSKQRKTPNAIKWRWIWIDLTSKQSKILSYVANHSKPLNYKSDQNTMTFTDLMSNTQNNTKLQKLSH